MSHYVRVLSTAPDQVSLEDLTEALKRLDTTAVLRLEAGEPEDWEQITLSHSDGEEIAAIEFNPVAVGSLASEELEEFAKEVVDCRPALAAKWLLSYFRGVRSIYALQVLHGTNRDNGWEIFGAVKAGIWAAAPSIIQADHEGFSNEEGYHILWQFSDTVSGNWWMGVLVNGKWQHFQMDLGNPAHREAFQDGRIPKGLKQKR
jgi:hypothetical protein